MKLVQFFVVIIILKFYNKWLKKELHLTSFLYLQFSQSFPRLPHVIRLHKISELKY